MRQFLEVFTQTSVAQSLTPEGHPDVSHKAFFVLKFVDFSGVFAEGETLQVKKGKQTPGFGSFSDIITKKTGTKSEKRTALNSSLRVQCFLR